MKIKGKKTRGEKTAVTSLRSDRLQYSTLLKKEIVWRIYSIELIVRLKALKGGSNLTPRLICSDQKPSLSTFFMREGAAAPPSTLEASQEIGDCTSANCSQQHR